MKSRALTPADLDAFLAVGFDDDPRVPAPLRDVQARDLVGLGCFGQYGETQMFLCEEGGRAVGRLAAIHNPRLPGVGQLGFVALSDDERVLPSLLEAAVPWLQARGATAIWGPIEGGVHRAHRVMVAGFETEPHLLEPRNPPWVPRLFEAAGFARAHTWFGYDVSSADAQRVFAQRARNARRAERWFEGVPLDPREPELLPRLHALLDAVWQGHVGYAPFDLDEMIETYRGILAIEPTVGVVRQRSGADVALGLSFPDWVAEARALAGDASGWAGWVGQAPHPERVILHTIACTPAARPLGAPLLVLDHAQREVLPRYAEVVIALVTEDYAPFFARSGLTPTREYALYAKPP